MVLDTDPESQTHVDPDLNSKHWSRSYRKVSVGKIKSTSLKFCSARNGNRIGLLEEIPGSGVQIPCLS
jgi:hypothetical protein